MFDVFGSSWRIYPSIVLMIAGLFIMLRGFNREVQAYRLPPRAADKALTMMREFRIGVVGLALAGLAAAWLWQQGWLAILSAIIAGEEMLESSLVVFGLKHGRDLRLRP